MKYLDEFRDAEIARKYLDSIDRIVSRPWSIMEICGGQTHSLVKNGIIDLLPEQITMVHGPGCPVCVTPVDLIDQAIQISLNKDCILCTFGDMIRVPGSDGSLLKAKANGGSIRIVYSPMDAVKLAIDNPNKHIVFFAVGFETTAPANALSVLQAEMKGLTNYFILSSHVLVPPAMIALLKDEETRIDGFLAAGHVCTVMGLQEYLPITEQFRVPVVVTGFEPVDMLKGLYHCVEQLENGEHKLENHYERVVKQEGNLEARHMISKVFEVADRNWRGIGILPQSGLELNEIYRRFDARLHFNIEAKETKTIDGCIAGQILKGLKKPYECKQFGKHCTPENPLGAPMVSSEGACAAYYNYSD